MKRRMVSVLAAVMVMFAAATAKMGYYAAGNDVRADLVGGSVSVEVATLRGEILDCNLLPITGVQRRYVAAIAPTEEAIGKLAKMGDGYLWALRRLYEGRPVACEVTADFEADGAVVFEVPQRYGDIQSAAHLIGYLNGNGRGASGLEQGYESLLGGYRTITVTYAVDASGRVLTGESAAVGGDRSAPSAVVTTIDSRLQQIVEQVAGQSIKKGAVVLSEVGTGKIRAMCSLPQFSPADISASLDAADGPFVNRAISAYNVGSVFKLCVCAAALEGGTDGCTYTCTGSLQLGSNLFNCHNHSGHGTQDISTALSNSCNPYFITLAAAVGGDDLMDMCFKLRFGRSKALANGIFTASGVLPQRDAITQSAAALANLSFGQGELMLTPVDVNSMTETIAAGVYNSPCLVEYTVDKAGNKSRYAVTSAKVISDQTAARLREMMCNVVANGTGRAARPEQCTAGGKTATAETGWVQEGRAINNSWFTGFFPAEQPKYALTVLVEDGISGSVDCAPVFKQIADMICEKIG